MAKLGLVITQVRGVSYSPKDLHDSLNDESIILLRANNIKDGKINFDDVVYIDKKKVNKNQYLCRGDVLICTSSGSKELVGKAAFFSENTIATFGAFCKVIRPSIPCKEFIGHFFNSPFYRREISSLSSGANINNIRNEHIDNLEMNLPTENIQEAITRRLNFVNSLIESRQKQLSKLDQLVKSRFIEMFGDPVENPYKWNMTYLNVLGELNRGISKHRPRNAPELLNGKYPLIQTGDIASSDLFITKYSSTYSEFGLKQSRMWPSGTLCITIAANIAKTSILKFDACFPDSVVGFISGKEYMQVFIYFWFSFFQKILEEQAPESAQKNINLKILNELKVITPPSSLQKDFFKFVQQVEKAKSSVKQSLEKLETLKKSLMQEYFG